MKTLIIQSFRSYDIPRWIARCLESVRDWAAASGHDYRLTGDEVFALCGEDYLAKVGDNKRSISNLARLELLKRAHAEGYARAIWMDADIQVFDQDKLRIETAAGWAFARETYLNHGPPNRWIVEQALNNSVIACMAGEPDLDLLITITRHIARHHPIRSNYQVGGDVVKGLHRMIGLPLLEHVGMFSPYVVLAIARGYGHVLDLQATHYGAPVHAANLCAGPHFEPAVPEADALKAMDLLATTRGGIINDRLPRP